MFCPRCGATSATHALFCQTCGASLSGGGTSQPTAAAARLPDYEPPSWALPVLGWLVFGVGLLAFVAGDNVTGGLTVVATAIIVGWDASRIGVRHLQHSSLNDLSGIDRSSTAAWTFGCLLLWIVVVPLYLLKRPKLARAAWTTRVTKAYKPGWER